MIKMLNRGYKSERPNVDKMPAFQLNKFQSEFNLSFNKEMAKIITMALQRNEEIVQDSGKNVPTCLYALLSKLEDAQKPRYEDRNCHDGESDCEQNSHETKNNSYEYH